MTLTDSNDRGPVAPNAATTPFVYVLRGYTYAMTNLTLAIDAEVLRLARVRAAEEGTTVNAAVRDFLEDYSRKLERQMDVRMRILELAERTSFNREGQRLTREEANDRQSLR